MTDLTVKTIRLLLADDHSLVRAGIRALVERLNGVEVVGEAEDGRQALGMIRDLKPDVVLLDIGMPGIDGFGVLQETAERFPDVQVIVLTVHDTDDFAFQALRAGAAGYLPKSAATAELELAINQVMSGEKYLSPSIAQKVALEYLKGAPSLQPHLEPLTPRQREVLTFISEGHSTKDIAATLNISVKTVETHRAQLMERLGIHDVAGLVRYAIRTGMVKLDD